MISQASFQQLIKTSRTGYRLLRTGDLAGLGRRLVRRAHRTEARRKKVVYVDWRRDHVELSLANRQRIFDQIRVMPTQPVIALIVVNRSTNLQVCTETLNSLTAQLYPEWKAWVTGQVNRSPVEALRTAPLDPRFSFEPPPADTEVNWCIVIESGDLLHEAALFCLARAVMEVPDARLLYSDEESVDEHGQRFDPCLKPDWNPDLLLGRNYLGGFTAISRSLLESIGGISNLSDGLTHDLTLRCSEQLDKRSVHHIPHVLYQRRSSPTTRMVRDPVAVSQHIARTKQRATVSPQTAAGTIRVTWPVGNPPPKVSVLIPTRDQGRLLGRCIRSIDSLSEYPDIELVVVDHETRQRQALRIIDGLRERPDAVVLQHRGPFNFAAMMNRAVEAATGEVLVLLNNDTEVMSPCWLSEMVGQVLRPGIGVVGALLLFKDGSIQHAGIRPGFGGFMGHSHKHLPGSDSGHLGRLTVAHEVAAVTGACLAIQRSTWDELGGLDEQKLAVAYNDVDLCLKARAKGLRVVMTPHAVLYHHESISRGFDDDPNRKARLAGEAALMRERWGDLLEADPAYNPNLTLTGLDFTLAEHPRVNPPWR